MSTLGVWRVKAGGGAAEGGEICAAGGLRAVDHLLL